jgi:hypothetical protein
MQLARNDAVYARKSILHEPRDEYEQKAHIVEENPFSMVKFGAKSTAISSRQINLHSYHHEMSKKKAYAEVKIGGHPLDYKRIFYTGSMLHGHQPIKTGSSLQYASRTHRSSLAYQFRGKETLEYACVKIGGHPLDHVPFIDRGQPSRPLLGYQHPDTSSPKPQRLQPQLYRIPRGNLGPQLYDCSRCLRLRQNARLQLCCGHPICSTCVSSSTVGHVKRDSTSFIECVQCNDYIAIQAVVFPHRTMSLEFPIARSLSALEILEQHQLKSPIPSQTDWRIQAALATLSFTAGQIAPRILSQAFKENFWKNKSKTIKSAVKNHTSQKIEAVEKKEFSIQKGPERWQKRLQSLEETSKLFKYRFIRTLGIGNFAEVMLVRNHKGQLVVLKESDKLQEALNEISILSKIQSPHVVQIKNYFIEQVAHRHFAYIEMEFCEKGDLIQLLNLGQMDKFLFEQLLRHLCIGLKEIHQSTFVKRKCR